MIQFPNFLKTENSILGNNLEKNKKFLFHHIPKTAGSTFRSILENFYRENEICPAESNQELKNLSKNDLNQFNLYAGHFSYGTIEMVLSKATWVTFLREPNERVISQYFNHSNPDRIPDHWKKRVRENKTWSTYINQATRTSLEKWFFLDNKHLKAISRNRQTQAFLPYKFQKEVDDWSIHNDKLLNIAKKNLIQSFRFFGIQEYFDLSLFLFFETLGLLHMDNLKNFTTNTNQKKGFNKKYKIDKALSIKITDSNSMDWELYKFAKKEFFKKLDKLNNYYLDKFDYKKSRSKITEKKYINENCLNIKKLIGLSRKDRKNKINSYILNNDLLKKNSNKSIWKISDLFNYTGLHKIEYTRLKESFSWTGAGKTAFLEINKKLIQGVKYKVDINVGNFMDKNIISTLSIKFNGYKMNYVLKKFTFNKYSNNIIFEYSANLETFYNTIEIISNFVSEDKKNKNSRLLGIAIKSISIKRMRS